MQLEQIIEKLDELVDKSSTQHLTEVDAEYAATLEQFLDLYPAEFFDWWREVMAPDDTLPVEAAPATQR